MPSPSPARLMARSTASGSQAAIENPEGNSGTVRPDSEAARSRTAGPPGSAISILASATRSRAAGISSPGPKTQMQDRSSACSGSRARSNSVKSRVARAALVMTPVISKRPLATRSASRAACTVGLIHASEKIRSTISVCRPSIGRTASAIGPATMS